jgi:predicted nucleic-acid-binding Zn-ribbon protein
MKEKAEKCAKCGAGKLIEDAYVTGYDDSGICVAVDEDPKNFFKKTTISDLNIKVCGACGFVEFYAAEPEKLYQAYLAAKAKAAEKKTKLFKI